MREVLGSCPLDCPDGCAWVVSVDEAGAAVRLRGSQTHPFTAGGLCKKVNPWLQHAADPSRLMTPLRRTGPKGSASFEPVSWDVAIAEFADRLGSIIERSGGSAVWPFAGTGNVGFVQGVSGSQRLWHRMGASRHHASICSVSGHVGMSYTTGTAAAMDPEEVVHAGLIIIWGSNTLVANQHWWPFVERARASGAEVVVVDPVATRTAKRADHHLAIRPGTDAALALGLCAALVDRGAVDEDFIARSTHGYDEFAEALAEWTLQRTADTCGVEAGQIAQLVDLIATAPPLAIKLGQGMQRQINGGQTARVVSCIPALVGSYGTLGGGLVYSTSDAYRFNPAYHCPHLGDRPRTLTMTMLAHELRRDRSTPVEALVIHGANPVVSNPDTDAVRAELARDDLFTVVIDAFPTETTAYADLVLPSTLQHEHLEVNDSFAHMYVSLNSPAVEPPGECLPLTEMWRRLARAMGYDDPELFATDHQLVAELLDTPAFAGAGITVESLRETGWARLPHTSPWRPFDDGFWTASRRFEFASDRAERDGHGRLPHYEPPAEATAPDGYALLAAASDWHVNSVFAGTAVTAARTGVPPLLVHPDDAARDGIEDDDTVRVANTRGSFTAVVTISADARPGTVVTTKGSWYQGVNATVAERNSDMGNGAVYHDNRVELTVVA